LLLLALVSLDTGVDVAHCVQNTSPGNIALIDTTLTYTAVDLKSVLVRSENIWLINLIVHTMINQHITMSSCYCLRVSVSAGQKPAIVFTSFNNSDFYQTFAIDYNVCPTY
jgi:hypothetical protein